MVGFDGVQALVLECVRFDLLSQSDAASFLGQVDQDPGAFSSDHLQSQIQLVPAVAAKRMN